MLTSNVYRTTRDLVLFFHRWIIVRLLKFQLLVIFAIIIIASLLKSLELAPTSYQPTKNSILNKYFAKFGWAWTMGLLIPFVYLTLITTHSFWEICTRHLVRLLVATGVWYYVTKMFIDFESYTGICKNKKMPDASRTFCVRGGYEWQEGHDISGHIFLLLYALLIISEEVKAYDNGTNRMNQASQSANTSGGTLNIIRVIFYVALAALTILWEFALLSTALYYHHTYEKIIAAILAVFFWYTTYCVWYRRESPSLLHPSSPIH